MLQFQLQGKLKTGWARIVDLVANKLNFREIDIHQKLFWSAERFARITI